MREWVAFLLSKTRLYQHELKTEGDRPAADWLVRSLPLIYFFGVYTAEAQAGGGEMSFCKAKNLRRYSLFMNCTNTDTSLAQHWLWESFYILHLGYLIGRIVSASFCCIMCLSFNNHTVLPEHPQKLSVSWSLGALEYALVGEEASSCPDVWDSPRCPDPQRSTGSSGSSEKSLFLAPWKRSCA